jgi:signal transduction histidine kinase
LIRARLAVRIAILYAGVVVVLLFGTMIVFRRTVGEQYRDEVLGQLRANNAAMMAMETERQLAGQSLQSQPLQDWLRQTARARAVELALFDGEDHLVFSTAPDPQTWRLAQTQEVPCGTKRCRVSPVSPYPSFAPLSLEGRSIGSLAMTHAEPQATGQKLFSVALATLSVLGFVVVLLLTLYLTRPLRQLSASMDRIAGGDLSHRVPAVGSDEVAQMAHSFNAMADRLERLIVGQKELMAGVSHELRSPLSRMKLSLEMLRAGGADEARVAAVDREIDRLDQLVHELLWMSRLELEGRALEPSPVAVAELAEEAWQRVELNASERGIELLTELPTDELPVVVDRALVVRLLGNLFENAVRHGGEGPVTLTAERQDDRVRLCVSDRGPGVPSEALPRLFEPLYRVDRSRSRKTGGTGLGLMIVKRAVEAHGGQVAASLPSAGGLAISFDLPAVT